MQKFFKNLVKYNRYAIRNAKSELLSEVTDSYLNWLWWIIEPLCFMIVYTFVFGYVFKNTTQYFASFVFMGLVIWDFFFRMMSGSVKLIVNNRDLVTKVYIPKYILLLSKSYTYLFKMLISLLLGGLLMIVQNVQFSWNALWFIPIILIIYIICFGIGMILMNFGVTLNDLGNLTNIGLKVLFYLSGVFYNINERINGPIKYYLLRANPVAFIMNEFRKVLIYGKNPSIEGLTIWMIIGVIICVFGIYLIDKNENSYAKVI